MRWSHLALISIAIVLSGCAGTRVIDSNVQAFSTLDKVGEPATYRFDRLPSQAANPQGQAQLEAIAEGALARVGLQRDDTGPRFGVEVDTRVHRNMPNPWNDPWFGPWGGPWGPGWGPAWGGGWGGGPWGRHYHPAFGSPWGPPMAFMEPSTFVREVHVVMRDLSSQKVVFESRAVNESLWLGDEAMLSAMFDAALKGFPQPPQGVRNVRIPVPPPADAAPATPVPTKTPAAAG